MLLPSLCALALLGLVAGQLAHPAPAALALAALVGAPAAWLLGTQPWACRLALACLALALGALRGSLAPAGPAPRLLLPLPAEVSLQGQLVQPPHAGPQATRAVLRLDPSPAGQPAAEVVLLAPVGGPLDQLAIGDTLAVQGRLQPDAADPNDAPPLLDVRDLRLLPHPPPGPLQQVQTRATALREQARGTLLRALPAPHAALAAGILLGGSAGLDPAFLEALQRSGLRHLIAIDGYKQIVVGAALAGLGARWLGQRLATLPTLLGIGAYTLLSGARPSAVRAALMLSLVLLARLVGRQPDALRNLALAAVLIAGVAPELVFDLGFQLSLSATLGLVLLWPRLHALLPGRRLPRWVVEPAGLTMAVTLATLPVSLVQLQSVSLVSPLAHIVATPLLPLVMAGAALVLLTSPVPPLAMVAAWLAWWPTAVLVATVELFGNLPGAALSTGRLPLVVAGGLALALLGWGVWLLPDSVGLRRGTVRLVRRRRQELHVAAMLAATLLGLAVLLLVRPDGRLHVVPLAVGSGQAVLIRGPTGQTALVTRGSPSGRLLSSQLADHLAVWEHGVETAVLLQPPSPALLAALARYPPRQTMSVANNGQVALGGGALLLVYAHGQDGSPAAAVSYRGAWAPVVGMPPTPETGSYLRPR